MIIIFTVCPRQDICEPICFKLGIILDMIKHYCMIQVWMTLTFMQGHKVMAEVELVQSFCCKVAWNNPNVHDDFKEVLQKLQIWIILAFAFLVTWVDYSLVLGCGMFIYQTRKEEVSVQEQSFYCSGHENDVYCRLVCWQCTGKILRVSDQNGVSLQWHIGKICHSGRKPLIWKFDCLMFGCVRRSLFKWIYEISTRKHTRKKQENTVQCSSTLRLCWQNIQIWDNRNCFCLSVHLV